MFFLKNLARKGFIKETTLAMLLTLWGMKPGCQHPWYWSRYPMQNIPISASDGLNK